MKKILFLLFACSIIFTFAGCSSSKKDSAEATTTQEIEQLLPIRRIPPILLPLIHLRKMILMIFRLIKKESKNSLKK